MADFKAAYKFTSGIEKGYTVDNGGATYNGIAFNAWKRDPLVQSIIAIVKAAKPRKGQIIKNPALDAMVIAFYKKNYWDVIKGDAIKNQSLANLVYDFFVNSNSAIVLINRAVGGRDVTYINETTLRVFNERPAFAYDVIRKVRKDLYDRLALKNPVFKKNNTYNGWIARLNSFPKSITA